MAGGDIYLVLDQLAIKRHECRRMYSLLVPKSIKRAISYATVIELPESLL